jgi:hypothetical protein
MVHRNVTCYKKTGSTKKRKYPSRTRLVRIPAPVILVHERIKRNCKRSVEFQISNTMGQVVHNDLRMSTMSGWQVERTDSRTEATVEERASKSDWAGTQMFVLQQQLNVQNDTPTEINSYQTFNNKAHLI